MNAETPTLDLSECIRFLLFWSEVTGVQHVTLTSIPADAGTTQTRSFSRGDGEAIAAWITTAQQAERGVYWTPAETMPGSTSKPSKGTLQFAHCRHSDIDPMDRQFPLVEERTRLAGLAACLAADDAFPPTIIVSSGNGIQTIWATEPERLPEAASKVENENRAVEAALGALGTHNVDRLLRLPGTINFPNAVKRGLGRGPSRARLIHSAPNLYTAEQAAKLAAHLAARVKGTGLVRTKAAGNSANSNSRDADEAALVSELQAAGAVKISQVGHLPDTLRQRLNDALQPSKRRVLNLPNRLADRWAGLVDDLTAAGKDDTRSAADLSVAAMLKARGFNYLDTGLILCAFPHGKTNLEEWPSAGQRLRHVARCVLRSREPDRNKPVIHVEPGQIDTLATEAENALITAALPIYQRGHRLVRPATQEAAASQGRRTTAACFADMTLAATLDFLARAAAWTRFDGRAQANVTINPPRQVGEVLLARVGEWRFPHVSGIITTPTLRPDRSILCEPGYDPATRLYLAADPTLVLPPIPAFPTREQALTALNLLDALLEGFPFVSDGDRAVALSALLTPLCRGAMAVAPLHAFRAYTAGTGKSYLCDLASALATGRPCPVAAAGSNGDETDKRLVGLLLAGFPIVCIDNLNGELGSDLLSQAVERPIIRLRRLGLSDIIEIESRATLFANGNALRVRGDMTRRTLLCDLDAQVERPELRKFDFDPVERVLSNRGKYVAAGLTVIRAFVTSGAKPDMAPLASYADYTNTVRGALVWLGKLDPVLSMEAARNDDPELGELHDVMAQWAEHIGPNVEAPAKTIIHLANQRHVDPDTQRQLPEYTHPDLRDALLAVAPGRSGIDATRFGKWLRSRKGRIVTLQLPSGRTAQMSFRPSGSTDGALRWKLADRPPEKGRG